MASGEQFTTRLLRSCRWGLCQIFTAIVGLALKNTVGIRVDPEEEEVGLDVSEHGMKAYNQDFIDIVVLQHSTVQAPAAFFRLDSMHV